MQSELSTSSKLCTYYYYDGVEQHQLNTHTPARSNLSFPGYFQKVEKYITKLRIVSSKIQTLLSGSSKRNAQKGTINFSWDQLRLS